MRVFEQYGPRRKAVETAISAASSQLIGLNWISRSNLVERERSLRNEARNSRCQRGVSNGHLSADSYGIVQMYDVSSAHPDASKAGRRADQSFLRRAVDINIPCEGIGVLRLQSAQPQDACYDRIPPWRIRRDNFTGAPAILEHCAGWRVIANFARDLQFTQRRKAAAAPIA